MGGVLRFWGGDLHTISSQYSIWKILPPILLIQIPFYFFDVYDLRLLRTNLRLSIRLLESLGVSFFLLAITYYSFPAMAIGRGILGLSLFFVLLMGFLWRRIYARLCRTIIQERILIIGTGVSSKKVAREIHENGEEFFKIIGFVGE